MRVCRPRVPERYTCYLGSLQSASTYRLTASAADMDWSRNCMPSSSLNSFCWTPLTSITSSSLLMKEMIFSRSNRSSGVTRAGQAWWRNCAMSTATSFAYATVKCLIHCKNLVCFAHQIWCAGHVSIHTPNMVCTAHLHCRCATHT